MSIYDYDDRGRVVDASIKRTYNGIEEDIGGWAFFGVFAGVLVVVLVFWAVFLIMATLLVKWVWNW